MMQSPLATALPPMRELVPHAGPMVLLDRVVETVGETLCAEVAIGPESLFCGSGGVPSWVGMEYMAQAIAAHAGYLALQRGEAVRVGFLLGSRRYEAHVPVFGIGSCLQVHVQCELRGENGLGAFACRISDSKDGAVLAQATITVFQPDNVEEFLQRSVA
jgi:predicted hotdog family 3-hydroxylacyl-ACP dehydratase